MSFPIIIQIMLATGIVGGIVNFLLPANKKDDGGEVNPWWKCIILGFGATLLVPLFLELAQSKLLDNIHYEYTLQQPDTSAKASLAKSDTVTIRKTVDTNNKLIKADTVKSKPKQASATPADARSSNGKDYFLFAAYCLLAASSGFKFINMLVSNIVKDEKINQLQTKNTELKEQKDEVSKQNEKRIKNSQINQIEEEKKVVQELVRNDQNPGELARTEIKLASAAPNLPTLPPITHPDDPQKDRFGGSPRNGHKTLKANVKPSSIPDFYNVEIWVESDDPEKYPLSDVIFYIHDSFSPSVYTIKPDEFVDGKAYDNEILSYGAFTIGAITDNGETMLELDLSKDERFPKQFRER